MVGAVLELSSSWVSSALSAPLQKPLFPVISMLTWNTKFRVNLPKFGPKTGPEIGSKKGFSQNVFHYGGPKILGPILIPMGPIWPPFVLLCARILGNPIWVPIQGPKMPPWSWQHLHFGLLKLHLPRLFTDTVSPKGSAGLLAGLSLIY